MKVLHVIPSVGRVRGGPSESVLGMVKALNSYGVTAEIATTNDNGLDLLEVPLEQRTIYQEVPIWFFSRFSPAVPAIREFAFSAKLSAWLVQNIHNYDLVHVHAIFSYPSTSAMLIARWQKIPYIIRPPGQLCDWALQYKSRKKEIYLNLVEYANINHSSAIHFTSDKEQQEASKLPLTSPSFIVPHGICIPPEIPNASQLLRQYLQVPEDEPIVLFMGRLHPVKGLDYLIPALGKLKEQRFTFVLAGSGDQDYEEVVQRLLTESGISDRTRSLGFVTGDLKNLLFQGANVLAMTSYQENFGMAALEAMGAGLPVIVSSGVGLASTISQNQIGDVVELDIDAISVSLKNYLDNLSQSQEIGKQARQFVLENYSWNSVAVRLNDIYTRIIHLKPLLSQDSA
jgi:glycosyltransferase involved in cell wall biosynthesis